MISAGFRTGAAVLNMPPLPQEKKTTGLTNASNT